MVGISHHHHRHHRRVPSTILATGGCEELGLLPPQYQQHQQQQHQQHQQQQHQQQQQYPHHFGNLLTQQDYAYFGGVPHGGVPFQPPPPPPPKQVRFNVQANQVYRWTPSAPNSHLWYNVREMENFRTIAQVEAKQICSASSAYSSFVSRTSSTTHGSSQWRREEMDKYDQNYPLQEHQEQQGRKSTRQQQEQEQQQEEEEQDNTTSTTNSNLDGLIYWHCQVVKKLHEDCHRASVDGIYPVLSRSEQEIIFNAPQLLGLERWIKRLRRDKATRIEEMMHCIASISSSSSSSSSLSNIHQDDSHVPHHHHPYQQQQRRRQHEEMAGYFPSVYYGNHSYHPEGNHIPYHHHHHHHESNAEEWIRWHCERISLPSRLFAFYMAVAQCPPTAPTLSLSSSSSS